MISGKPQSRPSLSQIIHAGGVAFQRVRKGASPLLDRHASAIPAFAERIWAVNDEIGSEHSSFPLP
jgi:hypothetical protein